MTVRLRRDLTLIGLTMCLLATVSGAAAAVAAPGAALGVSSQGLTLHVPTGWVSRQLPDGGITIADVPAGLGAKVPAGPELTVQPVASSAVDPSTLLTGIDRAPFVGPLTAYPTTVDGKKALYVEWTAAEKSGNETTRAIFVSPRQGVGYTLTLEAPAAKWTAANPAFDQILATIKFS